MEKIFDEKNTKIIEKKKNILFINHKVKYCGVYQYGIRMVDILKKSKNINYIYIEIENLHEYNIFLKKYNTISAIIYNYHFSTLHWLNKTTIQKKLKNIGLLHDNESKIFDVTININRLNEPEKSIPRPLFENVDELIDNDLNNFNEENKKFIESYKNTNIPIFGSFGFGFENKGFDKIVKKVNEQYDKAIIKFVIPQAFFDPKKDRCFLTRNKCLKENKKKGIILMISHNFFSTSEILYFLKSNTMNIFLYDEMKDRGPSSTIDYAVSTKKPIAISNSHMFKHIYNDDICLYKHSIEDCIKKSPYYCEKFLSLNSNSILIDRFDTIIKNILT